MQEDMPKPLPRPKAGLRWALTVFPFALRRFSSLSETLRALVQVYTPHCTVA